MSIEISDSISLLKWLAPIGVSIVIAFIGVLGLRFRDRIAKRGSSREDIKLLIETQKMDEKTPEAFRRICTVKAFEHVYGAEFSYDEILFLSEHEKPDEAFRELRSWRKYLHFDKERKVFLKQSPARISVLFEVFILSRSFSPKRQIASVIVWAFAFYIIGSFMLSMSGPLSTDMNFWRWIALFPAGISSMIFGLIIFITTMAALTAPSNLKDILIYLPFEDSYRGLPNN